MFAIISDKQISLPKILPDGIYNVSTTEPAIAISGDSFSLKAGEAAALTFTSF